MAIRVKIGAPGAKIERPEPILEPVGPPNKLTRAEIDAEYGEVTIFGIKTLGDGSQWVLHCMTGEALERKDAKFMRTANGGVVWMKKNEELSVLDKPGDFRWTDPGGNDAA